MLLTRYQLKVDNICVNILDDTGCCNSIKTDELCPILVKHVSNFSAARQKVKSKYNMKVTKQTMKYS